MEFPIQVDEKNILRPFVSADAPAMFALISDNRQHLDTRLRWSGKIQSIADAEGLITRFANKLAVGDGFHGGLWQGTTLVGGLVCHGINREGTKSEIGYWLGQSFTGQGIITNACKQVISALIHEENVHRIEIQCMVTNLPSRAVAERLGFVYEGIKRESEWINGAYADHAVYSLLAQEWGA
ncbi:MAG: GNAT family protein [Phototrophicales bacterium]|nr:GNAT family protein [Phototrophicales bacterium]